MSAPRDDIEPVPIESLPLKDPSVLVDPAVQEFYAYWQGLCGDDPIPSADSFELVDVAHLAPEMIMVDHEKPGLNFRFRLVGADIVDRLSIDPTGDLIADFPDTEFWATARELCRRVVLERQPYCRAPQSTSYPDRSFIIVEVITLPLLNEFGDVSRVISLIHFTN